MKYFFLSLFLIGCSHPQTKEFVIKAAVKNIKDSTKVFAFDIRKQQIVDSSFVIKNKFILKAKINNSSPGMIFFDKRNYPVIKIWLDNKEETVVNLDIKQYEGKRQIFLSKKEILKSETNRVFSNYQNQIFKIDNQQNNEIKLLKNNKRNEVLKKYMSLRKKKYLELIFKKPNNPVALYKVLEYKSFISKDSLKNYYKGLNNSIKKLDDAQALKNFIDAPILVEGEPIIDFIAKDVNGEEHQLSKYTKGVVLLDFWYSLCGPCRYENVNELPQIVNTYKDNNFKLISFSVETNHKLWKNAVEKDKMTWLNLTDLKGANSEVAIKYNLKFFPTFFIIKNGVILSRIEGNIEKVKKELVKIVTN